MSHGHRFAQADPVTIGLAALAGFDRVANAAHNEHVAVETVIGNTRALDFFLSHGLERHASLPRRSESGMIHIALHNVN